MFERVTIIPKIVGSIPGPVGNCVTIGHGILVLKKGSVDNGVKSNKNP